MKKIVKIVAFSFVMLVGMGSLSAQTLSQDQERPEAVAKMQVSELNDKLGLTGDQQRSLFRAFVSKETSYRKYVQGKDANDATVKAKSQKIAADLDEAMKTTLTKEQYTKWLGMQEQ